MILCKGCALGSKTKMQHWDPLFPRKPFNILDMLTVINGQLNRYRTSTKVVWWLVNSQTGIGILNIQSLPIRRSRYFAHAQAAVWPLTQDSRLFWRITRFMLIYRLELYKLQRNTQIGLWFWNTRDIDHMDAESICATTYDQKHEQSPIDPHLRANSLRLIELVWRHFDREFVSIPVSAHALWKCNKYRKCGIDTISIFA